MLHTVVVQALAGHVLCQRSEPISKERSRNAANAELAALLAVVVGEPVGAVAARRVDARTMTPDGWPVEPDVN